MGTHRLRRTQAPGESMQGCILMLLTFTANPQKSWTTCGSGRESRADSAHDWRQRKSRRQGTRRRTARHSPRRLPRPDSLLAGGAGAAPGGRRPQGRGGPGGVGGVGAEGATNFWRAGLGARSAPWLRDKIPDTTQGALRLRRAQTGLAGRRWFFNGSCVACAARAAASEGAIGPPGAILALAGNPRAAGTGASEPPSSRQLCLPASAQTRSPAPA